ncbi:bifunctional phosphoribosyl-AMP cyclohydrolase/phosphoribosyl-ATP diphosphatase HisIE [Aliidiomarina sp. Y6]|nr:bifunctional phosphoribosyl-AMP cyclohydrolase/phosphoribosyl-ATP diphosphatase HisIE [Aliidiomarina quisquiliarum]
MNGLLPCVVQNAINGQVLMQGYMNLAAAEQSLSTGKVTFFSRSKNRLWTKGESSGNTLQLLELVADCDQDALLALAIPQGPTCHLGTDSCWQQQTTPAYALLAELCQLEQTIVTRKAEANTNTSYTAQLLAEGIRRCAQKVGEEGVEVALAAVAQENDALLNESADLLYHLMVVLQARDLSFADVSQVLKARRQHTN